MASRNCLSIRSAPNTFSSTAKVKSTGPCATPPKWELIGFSFLSRTSLKCSVILSRNSRSVSPFLCRFPWAKVHMNIPRFRIMGLISHRKSASISLSRPSVLDSLTYVPFESFEIRISNVQDFRNFKLQKSRTVYLWNTVWAFHLFVRFFFAS